MSNNFPELSKLLRYYILTSTTAAESGHPTTCLSAVELMAALFFGGFYKYDLKNPNNPKNDRLIFSKGHAAPLLYALYCLAGALTYKELLRLRKINSPLEGHPTPEFKYAEAATGSLGQGLSIGLGMALALKTQIPNSPKVFVLLGDGEMAEGNVWEAVELASYYKVSNLIAILDVNRLGQSGATMLNWNVQEYQKRVSSFGWETYILENGHNLDAIINTYKKAINNQPKPKMIIAKTVKGKGVSFLENREGWHGKALKEEELKQALKELGKVDLKLRGRISKWQTVNCKQ